MSSETESMTHEEIVEGFRQDGNYPFGTDITFGTAEIYLREFVDYFKVLADIDQRIKADAADADITADGDAL